MIEMRMEPGGLRPLPICDHCGEVIECEGNVEWDRREPRRVYLTHKHCTRAFGDAYLKQYGTWLAWMDIDDFLHFLRKNLHARHESDVYARPRPNERKCP